MSNTSLRHRSAQVLSAVVLMLGLLVTTTSVAHADTIPRPGQAGTNSTPAVSDDVTTAHQVTAPGDAVAPNGYWYFVGIFPDPISCHVTGISSGRPFMCSWWVFVWALEIWVE